MFVLRLRAQVRLLGTLFLLVSMPTWASAQVNIVPPCPGGGAYPDFVFVQDTGPGAQANTMTIDLSLATTGAWTVPFQDGRAVYDPGEWIVVLYYEDLVVPVGKRLRFKNHASRAPVALLATGSVRIDGEIDVSGSAGGSNTIAPFFAEPGPGGFRGARGAAALDVHNATNGFGPGGSNVAAEGGTSSGAASGAGHATTGSPGSNNPGAAGAAYGGPLLDLLTGGSGGAAGHNAGGSTGVGGGGAGGGAIALATNGSLRIGETGRMIAAGGPRGVASNAHGGSGSGGAIRLVGSEVVLEPSGSSGTGAYVSALGGEGGGGSAGAGAAGRIVIEKNDVAPLRVLTSPAPAVVIGQVGAQPLLRRASLGRVRVSLVGSTPVPLDPRSELYGQPDVVLTTSGVTTFQILGEGVPVAAQVLLRLTRAAGRGTEVVVTAPAVGNDIYWTRTVDVLLDTGQYAAQARAVFP